MITVEKLAQYREMVPLGRFAGLGGQLLGELLDYVQDLERALRSIKRGKCLHCNSDWGSAFPSDCPGVFHSVERIAEDALIKVTTVDGEVNAS